MVWAKPAAVAAATVLSFLCSTAAHAGLFDDDEARKAIVELRARVTQMDEAQKARMAEVQAAQTAQAKQNEALVEQLAAMRRSLLDLNNQLEALRADMAKLRGADEQTARELADLQKRQREAGQVVDERLRKFEPVKVTADGRELLVSPEEKRAYDEAMAAIRGGDFDKSVGLFGSFQRRFGASLLADSARFWLGNALYGKRDYKEAITAYRSFVAAAPEHPRAAEALLATANSQLESKDSKAARSTLQDLLKTYPQSEAAQAGKERLAGIK
jgi:tol-pal system protein YbgF